MKILADPQAAAEILRAGGIVVYPAGTFFAVGCLADDEEAAALVRRLKGRGADKPLPALAASMEQAERAVNLAAAPRKLLRKFWPGPLSVLLPAKNLAAAAVNAQGLAAIRIDANSLARELAGLAGGALTASSANISGAPAPARLADLDAAFAKRLESLGDMAAVLSPLSPQDMPRGGLPSTIVEFSPQRGNNALRIIRAGAVSREALLAAGFSIN